MHMIIEKEKCLSLLHSPYITPYSIKSTDTGELHADDLEKIVTTANEIRANHVDTERQQYCISCQNRDKITSFKIDNPTNDSLFLTTFLQNELYDFDELSNLLGRNKIFASGLITNYSFRHAFSPLSTFDVTKDLIEVSYYAYPYIIKRSEFAYCRKLYTFETFAACDDCLYIYYVNGTYEKLFYTDLGSQEIN